MRMKLSEIQMRAQSLVPMAQRRLPYDVSKAIGKTIIALQAELKLIEEKRVMLAKEHSEKDEHGEPVVKDNCYSFTDDGAVLFKKEYLEFLETETDVEIYTINEETMGLLSGDRCELLTPAELIALDFMIEG